MRRLTDRAAIVGAVLLAVLVLLGLLGPWLPIGDPLKLGAGPRLGPPTWAVPFGADELGRSNLPRVVGAIRSTFLLAAIAVLCTAALGTFAGLAAAYAGRAVDQLVMRLADILFAFPPLLLAILIATVMGPGSLSAIVAIVLITTPLFVRVVRAAALGLVGRDFVVASSVGGAGFGRVVAVHLLPNVLGAAIVQFGYALSVGMLIESTLSFLGLGVQPPGASLGSLLRQGAVYLTVAPWLVFAPGIVLALTIAAVNLLADGIRDAVEPLAKSSLT